MTDFDLTPPVPAAPGTLPAPSLEQLAADPDRHLVVVMTRPVTPEDHAPATAILVTRFWHPRDRGWSENNFESLDHALRMFVDESGWTLLQQQSLGEPHRYELIFQARQSDFTGPSTEEILDEVGLTPDDVKMLLEGTE